MTMSRGFLMLSKIIVPPRSSARITNHPHATTSLFIDSGSVYLKDDPDKHALSGGPIPVHDGPVVVHNPTDQPAIVFAALAHRDAELYSVICLQEEDDTTLGQNLGDIEAVDLAKDHNRNNHGHHAFPQLQDGPAAQRPHVRDDR